MLKYALDDNGLKTGRILVLGRGFIGSAIARMLDQQGFDVTSIASEDCDLRDPEATEELLEPLTPRDTLVMAAARTGAEGGEQNVYAGNVAMTRSLAQCLHRRRLRQLVLLSSVDVYGPQEPGSVLVEASPLNPIGPYAQSKAVGETLLQHVCSPYMTPLMVLRFPGVYGPGDRGLSVVSRMLQSAAENGYIEVTGGGVMRRDYLFVGDLVKVVRRVIEEPRHALVNVASGYNLSLLEVAQTVAQYVDPTIDVVTKPALNGHAYDLVFELRRLHAMFPRIEWTALEEGLNAY